MIVLKSGDHELLRDFAKESAKVGIASPDITAKLTDGQWEQMLHKLRSVSPSLSPEEREDSKNWLLARGLFPGVIENDW